MGESTCAANLVAWAPPFGDALFDVQVSHPFHQLWSDMCRGHEEDNDH
jgi:hypothetical protein